MSINPRPLIIAAGVGLVVQIVVIAISQVVQFFTFDPSNVVQAGGPFATAGGIAGILSCCALLVFDVGIGVLYVFLANRTEPVTPGSGALGGAAASGLSNLVSQLFTGCIATLVTPLFIERMSGVLSPEEAAVFAGLSGFGTLSTVIIGLCVFGILGLVLGAVGGAISAAVMGGGSGRPAMAA